MPTAHISTIEGRAIPLTGADIDTDRIMPARFLRAVSFEGLEQHLFEDDRTSLRQQGLVHPFDEPAYAGASILVVELNFGCGSSREHAPQALRRWGIRAVVGESFSEIFFGNALALGMPCLAIPAVDMAALLAKIQQEPQTIVRVDVASQTVSWPDRQVAATIPKVALEAFLTGGWDATWALLEADEEVAALAARLPYVRGFQDG
jgi:3-isopropylmalate/(R)-2-methylmalate dehydratase small subunit